MSDITFTSELAVGAAGFQLRARTPDRVLRLIDRSVFGALLLLIVLVAIPFGTVESWWIAVYECAVFGLGACWIIESLISGSWSVRNPPLLAPVAALLAFTFLQSITVAWSGLGSLSADPFETRLMF